MQFNFSDDNQSSNGVVSLGGDLGSATTADPAVVAELVLREITRDGVPMIRYWAGTWWRWSSGRYSDLTDLQVRALVLLKFASECSMVRAKHVSDVIEHLRARVILGSGVTPPTWLGEPPVPWDIAQCLLTRDSIVHLPSLVAGVEPSMFPVTPKLFTTVATDFGFVPDAPEPVEWLRFLDQLWGNDPQNISTLQEIFGYLLSPDTRQQKIFTLIGPKRGGKGTIARMLTRLVGDGNVAGPTLSGLAGNFGLEPLLGKSLAIVSDLRLGHVDRSVVVERLLAISGEDKLTVDRKHKSAVHCQLPARIMLLSNELPRLDDASATIVSRMIVLKLTQSFYGQEDKGLEKKLIQELPGILLWAVEGWRRLEERGSFVQPDSGNELIGEMDALASPIKVFIRECCLVGADESEKIPDLYAAYREWCSLNGWDRPSTVQRFGRDLRAALPAISEKRPGNDRATDDGEPDGSRPRFYWGISLKSPAMQVDDGF